MKFEPKLKPHPSGRPIPERCVGVRSIWRVPDEGPVTPRLRAEGLVQAIGFRAEIVSPDDDDGHMQRKRSEGRG